MQHNQPMIARRHLAWGLAAVFIGIALLAIAAFVMANVVTSQGAAQPVQQTEQLRPPTNPPTK